MARCITGKRDNMISINKSGERSSETKLTYIRRRSLLHRLPSIADEWNWDAIRSSSGSRCLPLLLRVSHRAHLLEQLREMQVRPNQIALWALCPTRTKVSARDNRVHGNSIGLLSFGITIIYVANLIKIKVINVKGVIAAYRLLEKV